MATIRKPLKNSTTNTGTRTRRIMVRIFGMVQTLVKSLRIFSFKVQSASFG